MNEWGLYRIGRGRQGERFHCGEREKAEGWEGKKRGRGQPRTSTLAGTVTPQKPRPHGSVIAGRARPYTRYTLPPPAPPWNSLPFCPTSPVIEGCGLREIPRPRRSPLPASRRRGPGGPGLPGTPAAAGWPRAPPGG